ncbi:MAG: MOSC domain-containing protein [Sandaracinaceae bacterium]
MDERSLIERLRDVPQRGAVRFLGVRPDHEAPMIELEEVVAIEGAGLTGDRASRRKGGKRQVTLVQAEHLPVIAALAGVPRVLPSALRRNVVVDGINLVALKSLVFHVGDEVILEGTGPCEPCRKMDAALGPGAFHAMRGHGGITARIVRGGRIRLGDAVWV